MTKFDETKIFKRPTQFPRICPNSIDLLAHYNTLHFTSQARAEYRSELRFVRGQQLNRLASKKKLLKKSTFEITGVSEMDGTPIDDPLEAATAVNQFTANVGHHSSFDPASIPESVLNPIRERADPTHSSFSEMITVEEVQKAVRAIKNRKAVGIDELPGELIKTGGNVMVDALHLLFNAIWRSGRLPLIWKTGIIKPFPKVQRKQIPIDKLRPICLLPIISKVMEKVVKDRLVGYLESNELLVDEQSGFRANRNTTDNMVRLAEHAYWAKKQNQIGALVSLDIAKAYDSVNRDLLKFLLGVYGVSDRMLGFLNNFLSDRYGCVHLFGKESERIRYERGVPQGAVLSPVLFNMVINLICHDVTVSKSLFADDVNLWFFDESRPRVVSEMNRALGAMHSNADMLLLRFAVQKCKVLWFFDDEHDPGPDDDASEHAGLSYSAFFEQTLNSVERAQADGTNASVLSADRWPW